MTRRPMMLATGFSLSELILVIVLMGALAAISMPMLMAGFNAFTQKQQTSAIEREAMLALDRISREVRIGRQFVSNGASLAFERDDTNVEIALDDGRLMLSVDGNTSVLARNVAASEFRIETHESACYIVTVFTTEGINEPWRSVTYARNSLCEE